MIFGTMKDITRMKKKRHLKVVIGEGVWVHKLRLYLGCLLPISECLGSTPLSATNSSFLLMCAPRKQVMAQVVESFSPVGEPTCSC